MITEPVRSISSRVAASGLWVSLVVSCAATCTMPVSADGNDAVPSKAQLLEAVRLQRPASQSFQTVVTESRKDGAFAGLPDRVEQRLAISTSKCLLKQRVWDSGEWFSAVPPADVPTYVTAESGQTISAKSGDLVACSVNRSDIGGTPIAHRSIALSILRWQPVTGAATEIGDADLVRILESDSWTLAPALKLVDGSWCAEVEVSDAGYVTERLWLDRDHGWFPRLQQAYREDGSVFRERRVDEFQLVGGTTWLPVITEVWVAAIAPVLPIDSRTIVEMSFADEEWPVTFDAQNHAAFDDVCALVGDSRPQDLGTELASSAISQPSSHPSVTRYGAAGLLIAGVILVVSGLVRFSQRPALR